MLPCGPQGVPVANKVSYLMSFILTGIRNCLNAKRLLPIMHYLMPVVQLYIFLAQWRLVLSESAVYLLIYYKCFPVIYYCHYYRDNAVLITTIRLYHKIHELFYLWCQSDLKLQENCAINAQVANHLKTAVIVTFLAWSLALHRTAEPQEALWHFGGQCGARDCQNCKMCQMCQFD